MSDRHYEDWEFLALADASGGIDPDEVAEHVEGCESCSERMRELQNFWELISASVSGAEPARPGPTVARLDETRDIVRRMAAEEGDAESTFAQLMNLPIEEWWNELDWKPALRNGGLVRRVILEARSEYSSRPEQALRLLDFGIKVTNSLSDAFEIAQLRADLSKERANALRFLGRYPEALESLDWAERFLQHLPAPFFDMAMLRWTRASVLFYMTRFAEALPLVRSAAETLAEFGDLPRAQQAKVLEAGILYEQGDVPSAYRLFTELREYFERVDDRLTVAQIVANLAVCEARMGHGRSARQFGDQAAKMFAENGNEAGAVTLSWTLGTLLMHEGQDEESLQVLRGVASAFDRLGMTAEAGATRLDIVELHLRREEWEDATDLARELANLFTRVDAPVSAARAYDHLRQAVESRQVSPELIEYVRGYVKSPGAYDRFDPPEMPVS